MTHTYLHLFSNGCMLLLLWNDMHRVIWRGVPPTTTESPDLAAASVTSRSVKFNLFQSTEDAGVLKTLPFPLNDVLTQTTSINMGMFGVPAFNTSSSLQRKYHNKCCKYISKEKTYIIHFKSTCISGGNSGSTSGSYHGASGMDRVINMEILKWAGLPSMDNLLIRKTLRWTGHLLRMPNDRNLLIMMNEFLSSSF